MIHASLKGNTRYVTEVVKHNNDNVVTYNTDTYDYNMTKN